MSFPKDHLVNILKHLFYNLEKEEVDKLGSSACLNDFINDISKVIFTVSNEKDKLKCSNQVPNSGGRHVVFLKNTRQILEDANMSAVSIVSVEGLPLAVLQATLQNLFIPILQENGSVTDSYLQQTASALDVALKRTLNIGDDFTSSLHVADFMDEIEFWETFLDGKGRRYDREIAKAFIEVLRPLHIEISALRGNIATDLDEVVESAVNSLDELWRLEGHQFPFERMERLLIVLGDILAINVQQRVSALDVWRGDFTAVKDCLTAGIVACDKLVKDVKQLCTIFWGPSSERPWKGTIPQLEFCSRLAGKLREVLQVRSIHRQLTRLLSSSEQKELATGQLFDFFKGVQPGVWSPYTDEDWKLALTQFDKALQATEQRVSSKLRFQLKHLSANTLQLLQELRRYQELLKRPRIAAELVAERENLLGLLVEYVSSLDVSGGNKLPLLDMPPVVSNIYWARQLKARLADILDTNTECLSDLKGSQDLQQKAEAMLKDLTAFENGEFDSWVREINSGIKSHDLSLSDESNVLGMNGRMVVVNYSPRLGRLVKEIQQLSVLGLTIPTKIQELYKKAVDLVKQANTLEQIAHFHNTIVDRMIPSQRPMMLAAAQALERLITTQTGVTWTQIDQVDEYITKLQQAVETLSRQNSKLAFYHNQILQKVVQLMDTDLIKQQAAWKSGLRDIRDVIIQVEEMNFSNMRSWRTHWDFQIYKALEYQYLLSLSDLHSNLPEIKVQLIYRQQKLQFQPPIEEIKMKYYGQIKRFLCLPNTFRGVADNTGALYPTIVQRNAHRFGPVFAEAQRLFDRLEAVRLSWLRWVALGGFHLEDLAAENLEKADDWDLNFRASKNLGQEIAKLPCDDVKVYCITVSLLPIRTEMELQNRHYWDVLATSLQAAVLHRVNVISCYMEESIKSLNAPRYSMDQIAEAYSNHTRILHSSNEMLKSLEETIKMNKTLASWTKEKMEAVKEIAVKWEQFQSQLQNFESLIGRQVESMKVAVQGQVENLLSEGEKFKLRWEQVRPRDVDLQDSSPEQLQSSLALIKEKIEEFKALREMEDKLKSDYDQLGLPSPDMTLLSEVAGDLDKCSSMWSLYEQFNSELATLSEEDWIVFRNKTYRLDDLLKAWEVKLEGTAVTPVAVRLLHEIQSYKSVVSLLKYVRGDAFSDRHWVELLSLLQIPQKPLEALTVGDLLSARDKIMECEEAMVELNGRAASEIAVRQALSELDAWEVTARFTLAPHQDAAGHDLTVVKDFGEVLGKLADMQCLVQSIARSGGGGLVDRAEAWESKLSLLEDCVKALSTVQRKWIYLEPIFGNGSFTQEQPRFQRIDRDVRHIMSEIAQDSHVVYLARIANLRQTLTACMDQLAKCQAGLDKYLQEKRSSFPRFYFLGDDDLLELLGQATKERVIQAHLKKLFTGIHSVFIDDGLLKSVSSLQGEVVELKTPVKVTNNIEEWLSSLNLEVKSTLQNLLHKCLQDSDPTSYPSQILCLAESIRFSSNCEIAIKNRKLRDFLEEYKEKLTSYSGAKVERKEKPVLALKLKSLLVDVVYHLDIVEALIVNNVTRVDDWHWQKRLRFYLDENGRAVVRMADAEFTYSYEYQGTAAKLVWTPLTERCFLTLTQAMRSGLGGNPYGPAGTGKTESVKALGAFLGRQVLVFNCDEGIDVDSMARIFVGLIKCGAWGCFDEFNRLEETTLSGVSMLIQPILNALRTQRTTVRVQDQEVPMDLNCAIYVTLNPAGKGYGGRQKLPDNLKVLFRPVAMSAPDNLIIAQVSLLCDGFVHAKAIGRKLVELFDFCQHSLSHQDHYDWGLRALKTVLGNCGSLLREKSSQSLNERDELETAVEAVRFNTLSKLTYADARVFDQLVRDVFVGVEFVNSGFADLSAALADSCTELGLENLERQISKCVEVWEQMQQRMGVALVGPAGSGKTTILRLLRHALQKLNAVVEIRTLNPKAMSRPELLGHVEVDTRQWSEGVLTNCAAQLAALPSDVRAWLICDGDVDPEWVEALNSVLDDNRLLTLPSGWRIQFGMNMNFVFETTDLTHASPATVSRLGTVFLSGEVIDSKTIVKTWLKERSAEVAHFLSGYLDDILAPCVDFALKSGGLTVPYSSLALTRSALSLLQDTTTKSELAVGLIHGLGACMDVTTRQKLAQKVLEITGEYIPDQDQILNCYYNVERKRIDIYSDDIMDQRLDSLVLTSAARRSIETLDRWLELKKPILVCGSQGSGKGILMRHCLEKLSNTEVANIYCSALTCPQHVLYKVRQMCVATTGSAERVYRPKNAGQLVLYLKGLELAAHDQYGSNVLTAWLQQLFAHGGFHDSDLEWAVLDRVQVVVSLNLQGFKPNLRMTSQMLVYNFLPPSMGDMKNILSPHIPSLVRKLKLSSSSRITALLDTVLSIYKQLTTRFTSVHNQHYCFSPRNLTHWLEGAYRYSTDSTDPIKELLFAVIYEGNRIFGDRMACEKDRKDLFTIFKTTMTSDWTVGDLVEEAEHTYMVSRSGSDNLERLRPEEWTELVQKGDVIAKGGESDLIITKELLRLSAAISRAVSYPSGSVLLIDRPGVGRKSAARAIASMHNARLVTLHVTQNYSAKNFKTDLKGALQTAGVDGKPVYLLLEDVQLTDPLFLPMIASLISSGEVLGLFSAEELEAMVAPLADVALKDGYSGSVASYFSQRVLINLHIILVMDYAESNFNEHLEKNPSLLTKCEVLWTAGWSESTLLDIPQRVLGELPDFSTNILPISQHFVAISRDQTHASATPRRYLTFLRLFAKIYKGKRKEIVNLNEMLHAGISKLNDAQVVVDKLQQQAAAQEEKLAEKQAKASAALDQIGETMKNANLRKDEMEKLKEQTESKSVLLKERKKEIELELAEVEPLIEEARQAVGNIKNESLSEIRSLRAPPDVIRDILEGVLRLMGIQDTSWNSMKTFLAKRGVKEEIRTFDAHHISSSSRQAAEALVASRADSFDQRVAKRASVAAAPLAAWVKANIQYARVVEKIRPLEREQANLEDNLASAEAQVGQLSTGLGEVDRRVGELKEQLNTYTREAAVIEVGLARERETMAAAQELVAKLQGEYERWKQQLEELSENLSELPKDVFLAAAFVTYLGAESLVTREEAINKWKEVVQRKDFNILNLLSSEREKARLASEGLPADRQSVENSVVLLHSWFCPILVDPDGEVTAWLTRHSEGAVEVVSQSSPLFGRTLELAIRFGKTLLVTDVRKVHPLLIPVLRKSILTQGTRNIIYIGEAVLDYNENFRLFLITRDTNFIPCFDANTVDFTTTQPGLAGQLLTAAVDQERPDLGSQRSTLLKNKEELQAKLLELQHSLLTELGTAQGDILQNADLLRSLNETKANSEEISNSLEKSDSLERQLDVECATYKSIADFASEVYFALTPLSLISNMYRFSIVAFKEIFLKSLKKGATSFESQKKSLVKVVYQFVSRSLFKVNRLAFAFQIIRCCFKEVGTEQEWELLLGDAVPSSNTSSLPDWIEEDREQDVATLRDSLPNLYSSLCVSDSSWREFAKAARCEESIPAAVKSTLTPLQVVLVIQEFRPDRLHYVMTEFACNQLGVNSLTPHNSRLPQVYEETKSSEIILLVSSVSADPSEEVLALAAAKGMPITEVSLGQGQSSTAMDLLTSSAASGCWLLLKNCHLMPDWMAELEEAWRSLRPHDNFRLWLSTEPHARFPPVLARNSLKISYEAPPGIKKNLQRTYSAWPPDILLGRGPFYGHLLFAAAWLHAVVQERRTFIPQGWSKFYEITDADLAAAKDILNRVSRNGSGGVTWEWIRGLLDQAVYGGRIDSLQDQDVLCAYLLDFFNERVLSGRSFVSGVSLPNSEALVDYLDLIHRLPDVDSPTTLGLASNIGRSWQKVVSTDVIRQVKSLDSNGGDSMALDVRNWQERLTPILNLWKSLHQGLSLLQYKVPVIENSEEIDPIKNCVKGEFHIGVRLVQRIHKALSAISKSVRQTNKPDLATVRVALALIQQECPMDWLRAWPGPDDPRRYVRAVVTKTTALQKLQQGELLQSPVDLSVFFHPEALIKSVKQVTARKLNVALDELHVTCAWDQKVSKSATSCVLVNLLVEGAIFDGFQLVHANELSPSVMIAPPVTLSYTKKKSLDNNSVQIPLYRTSARKFMILNLPVACNGKQDEWLKTGAAFFCTS